MKAVMLKPQQQLAMEDVPKPQLDGPGQILVKVTTSAICGSDLHLVEHEFPVAGTLGHEVAGRLADGTLAGTTILASGLAIRFLGW